MLANDDEARDMLGYPRKERLKRVENKVADFRRELTNIKKEKEVIARKILMDMLKE